jgi:hypothetical protein
MVGAERRSEIIYSLLDELLRLQRQRPMFGLGQSRPNWAVGNVPGLIRHCPHAYEYPLVDRDPVAQWTLSIEELHDVAARYKRVAGFQIEGLNARPPIVAMPASDQRTNTG